MTSKLLRSWPGQINDIIELVSQIKGENLILVELGSFMGESMELFAQSGKFSKIFCVDPWKNGYDSTDFASDLTENAEKEFDLRRSQFNFIEKLKMTGNEASKLFQNETVDMVYIDALHTPEGVANDIIDWLPKIKKNGYVSGHDWDYKDGLIRPGILNTIGQPDYICKHVMHGGSSDGSWLKQKN